MADNPQHLWYTRTHEWLKIDGDIIEIGITDFAQHELGDLVFAEAVPAGRPVKPGQTVGSVESIKIASDIFSPVSGTIVASNTGLGEQPEQISRDPYGSWFVRIQADELPAPGVLMDAAQYAAFCEAA